MATVTLSSVALAQNIRGSATAPTTAPGYDRPDQYIHIQDVCSAVVAVPRRDPGSIHNAVALVPDGNGGVVETHPPLKRLQGPDLRRLAPPDNAAPFGDNRTVSEVMRAIDRQYQ